MPAKTVFIGSVMQSKASVEALLELGIRIDLLCSLDESVSAHVSDYYPLHEIARHRNIPYVKFSRVSELTEKIVNISPDFLFVIGISQIVPKDILACVKNCSIGFHPTALPRYRGRAPIPWMILLGEKNPAVTLFKMDEGMDSGDILHQEPYTIGENDYASDVYRNVCDALAQAIRSSIPGLYRGEAIFSEQKEEDATYILIRRPEDGRIDWTQDGKDIHTLIRAAAHPYPGAFAFYKDAKVVISRAGIEVNARYIGQPGQVAFIDSRGAHVLTNGGYMLTIEECEPAQKFITGTKLT